jgi:predicted nucleic acid-binding protein
VPAAVLVDTGPLVALLDRSDAAHSKCRAFLDTLESRELVTTEAVITEAEYQLDFSVDAQSALQYLLAEGRPRVEAIAARERPRIAELLGRYANLPMDYADATLVVLAERLGSTLVFTLDRRDFSLYRAGRRHFEILPGIEAKRVR